MKVLIGSSAMQRHFPEFRVPKDKDYFIINEPEPETGDRLEEYFSHPLLNEYAWRNEIATVDELYTIKISHIFWELKNKTWNKHKNDIIFLERAGATLIPELYALLYKIWEERYGRKPANLEQEPVTFFNKNVSRVYEHDSLHASVAYYDEPLFNRILRTGAAVAVDKQKFDALTTTLKRRLVWEELYATALERRVIPSKYREHYRVAYDYALKQLLTRYSKGWFSLFVATNLGTFYKPELDYVQYHLKNKQKLVRIENVGV